MGNVLTATHPQELLPLQQYLKDFTFDDAIESLGSTRFMKVARAANSAGCQVWKVFVSPDDSVNLSIYKAEFDRIAEKCLLPNCAPFRNIPKMDEYSKCVIICRPYHKLTLTDRLTTRPFVVPIERVWYIYQLLKALSQCHAANVCHGDLKSQNVLLSSAGWLHITDFAFFKPTYLPEDDPSIYSYFFDTSRRQTCYIAPERILTPQQYREKGELSSTRLISEDLLPSMDIFSAGCVIYELLSDGHPPFTYGSLFQYRKMDEKGAAEAVDKLLSECNCGPFGGLIKKMLSKKPEKRPTAEAILTEYSDLFPEMITYLYSYINIYRPKDPFRSSADDFLSNVMEADDVIAKLLHDKESILTRLSCPSSPADSAVFFISLVTANLRAIRTASVRINAMRLVVELSRFASPSIALQRVLPYLMSQVDDSLTDNWRRGDQLPSPAVQSFALEAIAHLVAKMEPATVEDSLVFTEYLFPKFNGMLERLSLPVVLSLAKYLGRLGEAALEFRRVRKERKWREEEGDAQGDGEADDRNALAMSMANLFASLHSKENQVKLVLVRPSSLKRLYAFFEVLGRPELLLSHMITMLNENRDWRMRVAFYETLPLIVKKRDLAASGLPPLLHQGLCDSEELVVARALSSIRLLTRSNFLPLIQDEKMVNDILSFLVHPNECIVGETAELLVSLDGLLSLADIHSILLPKIQPYLNQSHQLISINNKLVLMDSLIPRIPRELWREVTKLKGKQAAYFLEYLSDKNSGSQLVFRDLITSREEKEKLARMKNVIEGMIREREKNQSRDADSLDARWIDLREVDRKECSLIASTKDSFAATSHASMRMSVYDACVEELIGIKKREVESRLHSYSSPPSALSGGERAVERLRGQLVMHLHEHTKAVKQLSISESGSHVASCSSDGSFKIWSSSQFGGVSYGAVRSESTYAFADEDNKVWGLSGIGWLNGDSQLVVASTSGEMMWADANTEVKEISRISVGREDGPIEQIVNQANLTFVRTHHGVFYCYDSRVGKTGFGWKGGAKHCVWRRKASNEQGKITSFCVDPRSANWMVTTGTRNFLQLWDMRLLVEVKSFAYRQRGLPLNVWTTPHTNHMHEPHILVGNSICGEVSLFNIATGTTSSVWWPSHLRAPLDYDNKNTVDLNRAASAVCVQGGGWVLIGDTKGEMRKWNIHHPGMSSHLSGISLYGSKGQIRYDKSTMALDNEPVVATYAINNAKMGRDTGRFSLGITDFHRTSITDMAILPSGNILSSGSDGCIKVWS